MTISKKFTLVTLAVTLVTSIIGYFILNYNKNILTNDLYKNVKKELNQFSEFKIKSKFDVGISNAISISNDYMIKEALKTNNRDLAIKALADLSKNMKGSTPFKNIKVHIHTKNSHSFLRSWKPNKFGDDLNSFRRSVVKVNKEKKAINTFEVGKAGLSIRSVVPIFDENKKHLGSLEFMQGINSVAKSFDKDGDAFLLLMDKSLAVVKPNEKFVLNNYVISQKFINKKFLQSAKKLDFKKLLKNGYLIDDKYFYTFSKLKDFLGKNVGIALTARPVDIVKKAEVQASTIIWTALSILIISLIISSIISLVNMKKTILSPILSLKNSIDNISQDNSSETKRIKSTSKDEIGDVVDSFNHYLDFIDEGLKQDKLVIDESRTIIEQVEKGLLIGKIKSQANSKEVNSLVNEINKMISTLREVLYQLSGVLEEMSHSKYDKSFPKIDGLTGMLASLFSGVKVTQSSINELLALMDKSNDELTLSAKELSEASKKLSDSSNAQAASLEETAAAIEEISSTIRQSSENTAKMTQYAQNVTKSNDLGKELAYKTSSSMDSLNEEIDSIAEAITVIDQIAFQTNILSLNAAVEAATAGEAGKGFAVVAQEVRNLASRSAEAANEIKSLVESATTKAKDGKNISSQMIEGYNELNKNIVTTIELINDVASASKEQELAMTQINTTVNSLDQATQQNATLAFTINNMATKTSTLAVELQKIIQQTSYDKKALNRICDTDMIININKLKSDHISFKNVNFSECEKGNKVTVKNHNECNLGKWINSSEDKSFAKTQEWQELKKAHENVHTLVQNTIDIYSKKANNEEIFNLTTNLEKNIHKVFDSLDKIRERNCEAQS